MANTIRIENRKNLMIQKRKNKESNEEIKMDDYVKIKEKCFILKIRIGISNHFQYNEM